MLRIADTRTQHRPGVDKLSEAAGGSIKFPVYFHPIQ